MPCQYFQAALQYDDGSGGRGMTPGGLSRSGPPKDNFAQCSAVRGGQLLTVRIKPWQVCGMMADLKIAPRVAGAHRDSLVDGATYLAFAGEPASCRLLVQTTRPAIFTSPGCASPSGACRGLSLDMNIVRLIGLYAIRWISVMPSTSMT